MHLASWLKSFHVHGRTPAETVPLVNRQEKTVVETIVAHRERTSDKGRYFIEHLVKWNGYGPEHQIASLKCSYAILQIALRTTGCEGTLRTSVQSAEERILEPSNDPSAGVRPASSEPADRIKLANADEGSGEFFCASWRGPCTLLADT